jgi:hypothetical protein
VRSPRSAFWAAVSAAALLTTASPVHAAAPGRGYPVSSACGRHGPFSTVSTTITVSAGTYDVFRPAHPLHSQGETGAIRVATMDPRLVTSVMTFSLPDSKWSAPNLTGPRAW